MQGMRRRNSMRIIAAGLMAVSAVAFNKAAHAQADFYAGKSVSIFIGFGPGGAYDLTARVLARHMGKHLPGTPQMVPKNMPGAGSLRAAVYIYSVAPKDGTEFGIFGRTAPIDPLLGTEGAKYDALKFTWLGSTSNEVSTCVSWHSSPVKTAADLTQMELAVGAAGVTSPSAALPKVFNAALGMRFKVISGYLASANALTAMENGELAGFCSWGWVPMKAMRSDWIRDKKINVLFQIGLRKHPEHPDVPLVLDLAKHEDDRKLIELVVAPQQFARPFAAPPDLPPERAAQLRKAFEATVNDPGFIEESVKLKLEPELVRHGEVEDLIRRLYSFPPAVIARAREAMQVQ